MFVQGRQLLKGTDDITYEGVYTCKDQSDAELHIVLYKETPEGILTHAQLYLFIASLNNNNSKL